MRRKESETMWIRKDKKVSFGNKFGNHIGFVVNLWGGVRVGDKIFADAARCEAVCGSLTYSRPLFHFQYIEIHI